LTTAAGVASTYFEILSARERLVIAHANADAARQVLEAVRSRFAAGYASPVDVATQSGTVAGLEAAIPELEQSLTRALGALAVLVGEVPERFQIAGQSLEVLQEPAVAPGLPAELLRRRPDVELAEANLAAAHADLQAARAALFPSLTLTAAGGVANPAVNAAVNALAGVGPSLNLGAALVQAVFGGGRLRAQRDEARGREEELLAGYRASILAALMDTENALAARARLDAAREPQQQLLLQSELALAGARSRYDKGYTDFLGVLEAQRAVFAARDQLEQYRLARLRAIVSLCKALGGGWQAEPLPSDGIAHVAQGPATP
jgi:NodT family efflux transporter outer membrane factor (OMF) lipoprotein